MADKGKGAWALRNAKAPMGALSKSESVVDRDGTHHLLRVNKAGAFVIECLGNTWQPKDYEERVPESVILKDFTDLNGKPITTTGLKTVVQGGFGYRVADINSFENDPTWTVRKTIKIDYNKTPRRISDKDLSQDFVTTSGNPLDLDFIRKELAQSFTKGRG